MTDLKTAAREYFEKGINIVAVKGKQPLHEWQKWQNQRQSESEFEGLPWSEASGFAVICGTQLPNRLYLGALDFDIKNLPGEVVEKGKKVLKNLLCTQIEETPSHGQHWIYLCHSKPRTVAGFHGESALEVLGQGKLCVVAPSLGYKRINDNEPTIVQNLEQIFLEALSKIGIRRKQRLRTSDPRNADIRYCCKMVLKRDRHIGHLMRLAIAAEHKRAGWSETDIVELFSTQDDFDQKKCLTQIRSANPSKVPTCDSIAELGYCYAECPRKSESPKPINEFNPVRFAKQLRRTYTFKTTKDNETVFVYDSQDRIYKPQGEIVIKEEMARILDEATRQHYFNDITFYIRAKTYFDRPQSPVQKIAVENGILNVLTGELVENSLEDFITAKLPITYDPKADCPAIRKFLLEVVGESQVPLVQEFSGYALYQSMPIHKAAMFVGAGANGKSTLLNLFRVFLGPTNVSNVSLQALCSNRFAPAQLCGKLANICADIPDKALVHTGMFKMLTGNDAIMVEEKFKHGFSFVNFAKLLFSANKVPETPDDTDAFFRRWIIISCNNVFVGPKCDKRIIEKLTTPNELSGFLTFALDGLRRLLGNGDFSLVEDLERLRLQYIRQSNSAKAFIEERLEPGNSDRSIIPESKLYQTYLLFCDENNLPSMKKRNFTENMQQFLSRAKQTTTTIEGKKGIHIWQYVRLKKPEAREAPDLSKYTDSNISSENSTNNETMNSSGPSIAEASVDSNRPLSDLVEVYQNGEPLTERECCVCGYMKPTIWEARTVKGQIMPLCEDCLRAFQQEQGVL